VRADGTPLHPDWITALFHRHCERAGLPRIRLHDVRHSYATAALKAGVSPKVISERLGHATVSFTLQTYAHVIPAMDEHAASTVAALILGDRDRDQDRDRAPIGTISGTMPAVEGQKENWPGTKSQASGGSGGRI
jgi:integrase-like protein